MAKSSKAKRGAKRPTILSLTRALRRAERERDAALATAKRPIDFDAIMSAARAWHFAEVRSLVDSAIKEVGVRAHREPDDRG